MFHGTKYSNVAKKFTMQMGKQRSPPSPPPLHLHTVSPSLRNVFNHNQTFSCIGPSCLDLLSWGHNTSGLYILGAGASETPVYCDQSTNGGGWTTIQARLHESALSFNQNKQSYISGFGSFLDEWKVYKNNGKRISTAIIMMLKV